MVKFKLPRNKNLPKGISLLRQLNVRANATTLNLGLGKPEEDMPSSLRNMAEDSIRSSPLDYTENAGDLRVRENLALKLKITSGKSLILTHGAQEGLMIALMAILNPGDEVLVPDPGFLAYPTMVKIQGAKAVPYSLSKIKVNAYVHNLGAIAKKITSRTRAIIISSPGNPTGCDFSDENFSELLKIISRKNIIIVSDEVYGMLHFHKPYFPLATLSDRVISVNSFSKSHALTGWRIGYVATENAALANACLVAHQYLATCASVPSQRFLGELLKSPLYESVASDYGKHYERKLDIFRQASSEALRDHTPRASGGFYLFPALPAKTNSFAFCEKLLKKENVLAIPGAVFGRKGEGSIRLSLALPDQQVIKAAAVLSKYFKP